MWRSRYMNPSIPASALSVLVNTTVRLISFKLRQTCALLLMPSITEKLWRLPTPSPTGSICRAVMGNEPVWPQLQKNYAHISDPTMWLFKTAIPNKAQVPPLSLFTHTWFLHSSLTSSSHHSNWEWGWHTKLHQGKGDRKGDFWNWSCTLIGLSTQAMTADSHRQFITGCMEVQKSSGCLWQCG